MTSHYGYTTLRYGACTGQILIPFKPIDYDYVNCQPPVPDVDFAGSYVIDPCTYNSVTNE